MTGLYVADGYGAVVDANLVNLRWSRKSHARACASIYPVALTSPKWRSANTGTVAGDSIARGISVNFTVRLAASFPRTLPERPSIEYSPVLMSLSSFTGVFQ